MRRLSQFVAVLVIAFAFSACKKGSTPTPDTSSTTTMTLTSNGTNNISYNSCDEIAASVNNINHTLITGYNLTNGKKSADSFELDIVHDVATLQAGKAYPVGSSLGQVDAVTFFYSPTDTTDFNSANAQGSVTISGITATTITGTFSGKLFAQDDFDGTHVIYTVTNGAFTAKRH
jgi:hypothetical protein